MGVDKRGKDRGGCGECDCSDYEQPPGYGSSRCSYCDCPPTRHEENPSCLTQLSLRRKRQVLIISLLHQGLGSSLPQVNLDRRNLIKSTVEKTPELLPQERDEETVGIGETLLQKAKVPLAQTSDGFKENSKLDLQHRRVARDVKSLQL